MCNTVLCCTKIPKLRFNPDNSNSKSLWNVGITYRLHRVTMQNVTIWTHIVIPVIKHDTIS